MNLYSKLSRYALLLIVFAIQPLHASEPVPPATPISSEADWQAVLALDAGPQGNAITSREEARRVGLDWLAKQELVLRRFLKNHPDDSHAVDAQLRLAHLLSTRSDLAEDDSFYQAALQLLDDSVRTAPESRQADLAFAKIVLIMHRLIAPNEVSRDALAGRIAVFKKEFPKDRRVPELMVELASLYDNQPQQKQTILKKALELTHSEELQARINDDLKRLNFLGQTVAVYGSTTAGTDVNVALFRGKVVLVYFFATWSVPSVAGLDEVENLRKLFRPDQFAVVGVNLDSSRGAMESLTERRGIAWPIIWDGRGWNSPLVRGLAINTLPTLWILDKKGILRALNARAESETLIRTLLQEK